MIIEIEKNDDVYIIIENYNGKFCEIDITGAMLVKFVDPEKIYPVRYTIKQDGTNVFGPQQLKGKHLTENQIIELFLNQQL